MIPADTARLDAARGYLADYLSDEDCHGDESTEWFSGLCRYVNELPLTDPLVVRATECLQPFLDDDDRIDCAMYPAGEAVAFLEKSWGGGYHDYLTGFLSAMEQDSARWQEAVAAAGDDATWTLGEGLVPAKPELLCRYR